MAKELYSLCFLGKDNKGKETAYQIMYDEIDKIDMYTSAWSSPSLLFHMLPSFESQKIPCKEYMKEEFGIISDDVKKDNFFICKKSDYEVAKLKNKDKIKIPDSKKNPVLYRKDRDVVYLNKFPIDEIMTFPEDIRNRYDEIFSELLKLKFNSCSDYFLSNKQTYRNYQDKKDIEIKREKRLFFEEVIEKTKKRNKRLLEMFDFRMIYFLKDKKYTKQNTNGLTICLSTNRSNLKLISDETKKDMVLRRNLAMLIKEYRKKIDDINNRSYKTYLVSKYKLDKRQENNNEFGFDLNEIRENIKNCLPKYIKDKYLGKEDQDDFYEIDDKELTPTEKFEEATINQRNGIYDSMDEFYKYNDLDDVLDIEQKMKKRDN